MATSEHGSRPNRAPSASGGARLDTEVGPDHKIDVSNVDAGVLRRITAMAFRHRARMAVAITATILAAIFQLFVPQYLGRAVDQAQGVLGGALGGATGEAEQALLATAGLLVGVSILRGLCAMMQNYQGEAVVMWM